MSVADKALNGALRKFGGAKEGARRFQKSEIGDVDPEHCFADWLLCVGSDDQARLRKEYGTEWTTYKAAMAEGSGQLGGYLVPTDLRTDLYEDVAENSIFRPRALVVPMDTETMKLPLPDAQTVQAAATTPFYGGIVLTPVAEGAAVPEQAEPTWRQVELNAWTLMGYLKIALPLLQDGRGLEAYLRQMIARSVAWYEDYYFLRGTGVGQPMGILNSPALLTITASRQTSGHIKSQDAAGMLQKLLPSGFNRAIWIFAVDAVIDIVQLTSYFPNYPDKIDNDSRAVGTLFGRPAFPSEKLIALGTTGDFVLTDPTRYVIGDREQIGLSRSAHVNFLNNQDTWRIIHRIDGQPWFGGKITLQDGTRTVSTIVTVPT